MNIAVSPENHQPKHLWFLMLSYCMVIVLANWFDPRLVHIFGFDTDAGTIIFPLTFLLSNLITEVYGYKQARRAIWTGFLFNGIFILYSQIVIHLPSPSYPTNNDLFLKILHADTRIIVASCVSYFFSEPTNSFIMAKLKLWTKGRHLSFRFVTSTIFAAAIDSFIFGCLAFYGVMSNYNLSWLVFYMWLVKVSVEIFGLSISIPLSNYFKKLEKMDIYDINTNFNVFKLDAYYTKQENLFNND
jgi:queuosine precursor transporter